MEDGYAALRHRADMVNGVHVPTADILLRGEAISLHHILHISAAIAVAFQGPRLQVHHGRVGIDGRHLVRVAHSPIVDNQSATAHALHASLLGKSLTTRKRIEAVPSADGFLRAKEVTHLAITDVESALKHRPVRLWLMTPKTRAPHPRVALGCRAGFHNIVLHAAIVILRAFEAVEVEEARHSWGLALLLATEGIGSSCHGLNVIEISLGGGFHLQLGFLGHHRLGHIRHGKEGVRIAAHRHGQARKRRLGAQTEVAAKGASNAYFLKFSILPTHLLNDKSSAGTESVHLSVIPPFGQGGQQVHRTVVALHQHLGNARRATKVAVNLERRMRVEEVGIGSATAIARGSELFGDEFIGTVAVEQSRPQAHLPTHAPSRGRVATIVQGVAHTLENLRRGEG